MLESLPTIITPFLVALIAAFLIYRLGFFSSRDVSGRFAFLTGSLIVLAATGFEVIKLVPAYPDWFVPGAYPVINLAGFLVGAIGLVLIVVGLALHADYWQVRREEVDERFSKLSILENLQHDARQPYHLLELLNISLRELLVHYPLSVGAVFLVNRTRRQFVLTGSSGLRKEEVAYLEYYPLERNLVSQAVDLGDPMLASRFDFIDRAGQQVASRFRSVLVLPLVSGMDRIGCMLLLSEELESYGREDIRHLAPVAQWLAEKIKSARLARELSQVTKQRDSHAEGVASLVSRLSSAARAGASAEAMDSYCRALVGLAGSESVHLCAVSRGNLVFLGGSEPFYDFSENFRAALVDGMDRTKPLIINQESTESDGTAGTVQSNLIYPLTSTPGGPTLLLIRSGLPFEVNDIGLRTIEGFAHLAGLILQVEENQRSRLTRRKGFDAILSLLQSEPEAPDSQGGLDRFLDTLHSALPKSSRCLMLAPGADGSYSPIYAAGPCPLKDVEELAIAPDEGGLGMVLAGRERLSVSSQARVGKHLKDYHDQNQSIFQHFFGEAGRPDLLTYCPLPAPQENQAVVVVALYGLVETDRGEWERLITLAAGLYSLRATLVEITATAAERPSEGPMFKSPAGLLNELNNHLSAVIGVAEMAERNDTVSETTRRQLQQILRRAERAAELARRSLTATDGALEVPPPDANLLHRIVETELATLHVSGNLYMAGQRPREIKLRLSPVGPLDFSTEKLRELFHSVLNRFGAVVEDTDLITIATYVRGDHAFLDISRHRPNFPPVDEVAAFGRYTLSSEAFRNRPTDIYLRHLQETSSYYAVDTSGVIPAFLSFKFRLAAQRIGEAEAVDQAAVRLLAIDDQPVILDLIVAMGRSLGYEVQTASTGEAGRQLADRQAFDLVLTDLALPDISGLEVAQYIHQRHPEVPIVLVTGWSTKMSPQEQQAAGIREVLYKPFRIEQLTAMVQSVVNRQTSL